MLFGLDMLKRYQASIDLRRNALIIQEREVPFLAEHEIPKSKLIDSGSEHDAESASSKVKYTEKSKASSPQPDRSSTANFQTKWPQEKIATLTSLGINQEMANQLLNASNGDAEMAASIYFQNI